MRHSVVATVAVFAALVLASGAVLAGSSPKVPTNGVYWACYNNGGEVKFIDYAVTQQCPANWMGPVSWSQTGPQGPAGAKGDTGAQGPKGDTGPAGAAGAAGAKGDPGATGAVGATGATGSPGLVWKGVWDSTTTYLPSDVVFYDGSAYVTMNETHATPPSDPWSLVAAKGATGATGATGANGAKGDKGDTGPAGPGSTLTVQETLVTFDVPAGASRLGGIARCAPNTWLTGGGGGPTNLYSSVTLIWSGPLGDGTGWEIYVNNPGAASLADVRVLCASLSHP
jgi:hypothetical protein